MAVKTTNTPASAPSNAPGTNAGGAPPALVPETNAASVPSNAPGTNTTAVAVQPGGQPAAASETPAQSSGFWDVFSPALILAVFAWMWKRGHLLKLKNYVGETREQLRKCTWPTRSELYQHTVVVMLSTILLAIFTVAADLVIREIVWGALLDTKTLLFEAGNGGKS